LGSPDVAVVKCHGKYDTSEVTDEAVDQGLEGHPERGAEAGDVVPVEADAQETHSLVTLRTTEEVCENGVVAID